MTLRHCQPRMWNEGVSEKWCRQCHIQKWTQHLSSHDWCLNSGRSSRVQWKSDFPRPPKISYITFYLRFSYLPWRTNVTPGGMACPSYFFGRTRGGGTLYSRRRSSWIPIRFPSSHQTHYSEIRYVRSLQYVIAKAATMRINALL